MSDSAESGTKAATTETPKTSSESSGDTAPALLKGDKTLKFLCQECGACSPAVLSLSTSRAEKDALARAKKRGPGVRGATEDSNQASEKDPKVRTRVGRWVRNDDKDEIVDEADWDGRPDPTKDGEFAITIEHQRRMDMWADTVREFDELTVISPALVKAIRSVVKYFPGIGLDGSQISFEAPYAPLFFYFDELSKFVKENSNKTDLKDMDALTHFYSSWVKPGHDRIKRHLAEGSVQFDDLWALIRPGDTLYTLDESGEPCFQVVIASEFRQPDNYDRESSFSIRRFPRFAVDMWHVGWDSATAMFQRVTITRSIRSFSGSRQITSLPFYPLDYYKEGDAQEIKALKETLRARGLKWKVLASEQPSCKFYEGPAVGNEQLEIEHLGERVIVDGTIGDIAPRTRSGRDMEIGDIRGMIGGLAESRNIEYERSVVGSGLDRAHDSFDNFPKEQDFSKFQAELCPSSIMAYAIKSRAWFRVSVSLVKDVAWGLDAFDHLVLEEETKEMLAGLVQQHRKNKDKVLGDVIESKGKGLVIVLHGAPGVGKTLTAETIAEYTEKPLYPINIGELTSDHDIVETLQRHFTRASRWDAVLLLDEADVLLEKRSFEDLHRNGIVSVFLRMLEYYEGILFLTTNRLLTMDPAFQSRIHIAIRYPDLTPEMRREIWEKFIHRLDALEAEGKRELLGRLDDMEAWPLNGRQIRNVLATAESLSLNSQRRRGALRYSQVEKVANETIRFQDFFEDSAKDRKSQLGDFGSRQFQERKFRGPR